jgi:hypothetical protein
MHSKDQDAFNAGSAFDDLEDEAFWEEVPEVAGAKSISLENGAKPMPMGGLYKERCVPCGGSGRYYGRSRFGSECFACKGKGFKEHRSSPEDRAKGRVRASQKRMQKGLSIQNKAEAWIKANPALDAWMRAAAQRRFGFAVEMQEALFKYGHLSEKQEAVVRRLAAQDAEKDARWAAERAAAEKSAPAINVGVIEEAFAKASRAIKKPFLKLAGFKFSPAPASGQNAGAIYAYDAGSREYLGKIKDGKFVKGFKCEAAVAAKIIEVAADPKAAAIAYGKEYGQCACCGRELSNPESVALGIGPICAGRFGW